ncbi:hypothetical protein [Anaeroselena agilis]|uniref:Uncharacterized protein n=1 Tax=Anaeroselena agilis TaxID=3063788 RepID=A0ABU3NZH1_9FIRM|nr:hypothetical protein [Selenomonadales bacterium 4137-cl]
MKAYAEFTAAEWNGPITHAVYRDTTGALHLAAGDYGAIDPDRSKIVQDAEIVICRGSKADQLLDRALNVVMTDEVVYINLNEHPRIADPDNWGY